MAGWIKIDRGIVNHWIWKDDSYLKAWIALLLAANHEEKKTLIQGELITCKRGQVIMSLSSLSDLFGKGWSIQRVRTFLKLLSDDSIVEVEGLSKTTRVTVCKYDIYQGVQQTINKQSTSNQQATNKQSTTTKEGKNKKKYKDILMVDFDTSDCSEEFLKSYTIAESFRKKFIQIIDSKGGSLKELEEAKVEAWVNPIISLQKTDKVSIDKIREVYKEFGNLDFWAGVISSTSGVRKNFNKLVMAVDKLKPNQKVVSSEMTDAEKNKLLRQQMGI